MSEQIKQERAEAVATAMDNIKSLVDPVTVTRPQLEKVLAVVRDLAAQAQFWSRAEFADPEEGEHQARYLISQTPDQSYALYLNVMRPGKRIPPHNHTTWACITGVEGEEINTVYDRKDDGASEGYAVVEPREEIVVGPDRGITLLADDIHSVEIRGQDIIRHLHMYGRALETLDERLVFDPHNNSSEIMKIGVQTRR